MKILKALIPDTTNAITARTQAQILAPGPEYRLGAKRKTSIIRNPIYAEIIIARLGIMMTSSYLKLFLSFDPPL
jgi:hypothetical protein